MIDYRNEHTELRGAHPYDDSSSLGAGAALIGLLVVFLLLASIFWFAGGSAPDNGTAAPAIDSAAPSPAVTYPAPAVQ